MLSPKKTIDPESATAKLDNLAEILRRETNTADVDPFDEAMLNAIFGLIETVKSETMAFGKIDTRIGKLARRT